MEVAPSLEHSDNGGPTGPPLPQTNPKLIDVSAAAAADVNAPPAEEAAPARQPMSLPARAYVWILGAVAISAGVAGIAELGPSTPGWLAFVLLTAVAALAQLFIVEKGSNQSYRTAIAFILAACIVFVAVHHALLSGIISLTSGTRPWATGLFNFESLSTDLGLAALGVGIAAFWSVNGWLILFVIAPLVLIHRAMYVPQLQEKARLDPKTGLLNAREFETSLAAEIERSTRAGMPLSLLMLDLDFLRDINNTHGHLAGDVVIRGIADIFREQLRRYDIASRFGGEEFAILLPETPHAQAAQIAERIRREVSDRRFEVETADLPVHATVSVGVAGCPEHATGPRELVHRADLAVYRAKAGGRDRVEVA